MKSSNIRDSLLRLLLFFVLAGHLCLFTGWWFIAPKGFLITNPHFWTNSVIPVFVIVLSLSGILGLHRKNQSILAVILPAFPAATLAFMIGGRILYPASARPIFLIPLFVWFLILCLLTWVTVRHSIITRKQMALMVPLLILALFIGAFLPWSQRSREPATKPLNPPSVFRTDLPLNPTQSPFQVSGRVTAMPQYASVLIGDSENPLEVWPLLTFHSRSPDRCWILFAPRADRIGPKLSFAGMRRIADGIHLEYTADGRSVFDVKISEPGEVIDIEAFTELPAAVYSHLNTYAYFTIQGRHKLSVSFSPCPDARIEIVSFEYPFGKPMRLAYLDPAGIFRVVQAESAEKGPFTTLAEGPLPADQPLELTLFDGEDAVYRITFLDWVVQASRQVSPTAGWGLPENAIEFALDWNDATEATFYITLAATSAGRGFDTVGHTPGTYQNQIQVKMLKHLK